MDIPLNAEVRCTDGVVGRSLCLIINPVSSEITHLVVKTKGPAHDEYMVPLSLIVSGEPDTIDLRCSREEITGYDPFVKSEFLQIDDASPFGYLPPDYDLEYEGLAIWPYLEPGGDNDGLYLDMEQIPAGELGIHRGARVEASDGPVGHVDAFLINPENNQITHLVLREGHIWGEKDVTIAASDILRIDRDVVHLKLDKKTLRDIPGVPIRRWSKGKSTSDHH